MQRKETMCLKLVILVAIVAAQICYATSGEIEFTYNGFRSANLSLDGVAQITSNGLLRLTNEATLKIGRAFYHMPINFKNSPNASAFSFSTTFVCAMVPQFPAPFTHGFTFAITPPGGLPGALPYPYFGLFNETNSYGNATNHVVAVEFDTTQSPQFDDIDNNHVGIDINGLRSALAKPAGYYQGNQFHNLSLGSGKPIQVWVEYDGRAKQMNVTVAPLSVGKPSKPLLSFPHDISLDILETVSLGFTSATGSIASSQYVLGWSFKMNGIAQELDPSKLPKLPRVGPKRKSRFLVFGVPVIAIFSMIIIVFGVGYYVYRKRKFAELVEDWELDYGPHRFNYKELYYATKGFSAKEILGAGGFGSVYRGVLPNKQGEIAVKKIYHQSTQGMRAFIAEVASMGRLCHRNLVPLLGYCRRKRELLLVYEYMPNGSLDRYLFDKPIRTLSWDQRFQVIKGVASALFYIHEEWEQVVIHRDIKASNVLLDGEWNGRLGDFGLARLYDHGTDPQTTHVVGTHGYLAPEHIRTGKATPSSDMFAFGAFLLEVACGRRPIEQKVPNDVFILVEWVFSLWSRGEILHTVDPKLGENYVIDEANIVLKLGLLCSLLDTEFRPTIRQVVRYLEGSVALPELSILTLSTAGLTVSRSEGFDDFVSSLTFSGEKIGSRRSSVMNPIISEGFLETAIDAMMSLKLLVMVVISAAQLCCSATSGGHEFTFHGFNSGDLTLDGIAEITSNGLLRLTNETMLQKGRALYPMPINFKNSSNGSAFSFSTTFVCAMVPQTPSWITHGIMFAITQPGGLPGALPNPYFGLFNETNFNSNATNHVVAVELDTLQNPDHDDIDNNHVGIDINRLISVEAKSAGYYQGNQFHNFSLGSSKPIQAWVEYDGMAKQMNVTVAPLSVGKPSKPLLSFAHDISLDILETVSIGFTAATGSAVSTQYILGWSFKMNGIAQELDPSKLPKLPRVGPKRKSRFLVIGVPVIAIFSLIIIAFGVGYYVLRKRKFAELLEDWEQLYGPHRFNYKELYFATKGFSDKQILGAGGFGKVYRGVLTNMKAEIAVKKIHNQSTLGTGMRPFIAEVVSMGRLCHRNLVPLRGYCRRKRELLLVYEYMPNGSLDRYLFDKPKRTLSWNQRFQVIKGVASALFYLHEEWEQVVIHRDVKASNVLLDSEWNGRLGDFGLARLYDHGSDPQTTHVAGTHGYLAPEHVRTGKATTSSDMFAFGAFLLEVACGRRPIEQKASNDDLILVEWVFSCWNRGEILQTVDPKLGEDYDVEEVDMVLKLGLLCSLLDAELRPNIRQVIRYLERFVALPKLSLLTLSTAGLTISRSEGFDDFVLSLSYSNDKIGSCYSSITNSIVSEGR
nr:L-type lectin-domain containing receptor kinase IV.1 [Ipomoea batatas]